MMYADVVMEKGAGIEPKGGKGIRKLLDEKLESVKVKQGYKSDTDLTAADLKALVVNFKKTVKKVMGTEFPEDPWEPDVGSDRSCIQQLERKACS